MTMSRKDYEAVAEMLDTAQRVNGHASGYDAVCVLAWEMSDYFATDNPRFNRARFLRAAGFATLASIEEGVESNA